MISRGEEVDLLIRLWLHLLHLVLILIVVRFVHCLGLVYYLHLAIPDSVLFLIVTSLLLHLIASALDLFVRHASLPGSGGYWLSLSEAEGTVTPVAIINQD